ncbi:response regulator [Stenotrophomonas sp. B1-1]|uniref:response regulator n=1 Tax=Stenotrophomonas sp. B1-1 TaxID=2710648 RepID=UPI0013D96DCD|nr:response regulator [Stenotrophomonas sp. B1-1]
MKLTYRVLWFDDNELFFDSLDIDLLQKRVSDWGFLLDCKLVTSAEEFTKEAPYSQYDLLVVDYRLEGIGEGQDFIREVRDQQVFTEIIFYSSNATDELWNKIREKKLEGVFVANRRNIEDRVISVGHQSLRKVLDLDNMRGIVMAEVGDLDQSLMRVIRSAFPHIETGKRLELFDRFHSKTTEFQNAGARKLESFRENPSIDGLLELCDSSKLWQNFNRAKKQIGALQIIAIGNYEDEILTPRNHLAHGVASTDGSGDVRFSHRNNDYIFNEAVGTELRKKIIEYKGAFRAIETALQALEVPASPNTSSDEPASA